MTKTITGQIYEASLAIIAQHPEGIRRKDLLEALANKCPDFHGKTINGCVWKLPLLYGNLVVKKEGGILYPVEKK